MATGREEGPEAVQGGGDGAEFEQSPMGAGRGGAQGESEAASSGSGPDLAVTAPSSTHTRSFQIPTMHLSH